jgi:hypothetical protein
MTAAPDSIDDKRGMGSNDPKVLLLFALLTPVLILAAGMFAGRKKENRRHDLNRPPHELSE